MADAEDGYRIIALKLLMLDEMKRINGYKRVSKKMAGYTCPE